MNYKLINLFEKGSGKDILKSIYGLSEEQIRAIEDSVFTYNPPLKSDEEIEELIDILKEMGGVKESEIEVCRQDMKDRSRYECWPVENCVEKFLEITGIQPETYDLSDVRVRLRHYTAVIDHGESIKKYGLLKLDDLLSMSSPLSEFLKKNGIIIKPAERIIIVDNKQYDIDHKGQTGILATKLYYDKGEVEFFVNGNEDDMINYSCIYDCPEILDTLDGVFKHKELKEKWCWKKTNNMMVEFDSEFDECIIHKMAEIKELEWLYGKNYYEDIPKNIILNYWVISKCLGNYALNSKSKLEYAAIKPDVRLEPKRLNIYEI